MKNVIFSETKYIEKVLLSGDVTQDNVVKVIGSMAKYNLRVGNLCDEDNYRQINNWLKINYRYYTETELCTLIRQKIKAAHNYSLLESSDLVVYQSELDVISSYGNIRYEKILFVLLCIAKLQKNIFGYHNGKYKFALTNLFKLARVNIPSTERNLFMHELYNNGYINAPFKIDEEQRYINFMSDGNDDVAVLTVNENDFNELAYVYENWKNNGCGFTRCEVCNKLIQQSKTRPRKYCKDCATMIEKQNSKERVHRFRDKCNENLTVQN